MFTIVCGAKHVPKQIRSAQETKVQLLPRSTYRYMAKKLRRSGVHELLIAKQLAVHGKANHRIACHSGDNYQRLFNATASAAAKDTTKDTAHVVFTSSLKTGDVAPTTDDQMYRPPLDPTVTSDVHFKTYDVDLKNQMLDDATLSVEENLPVLVKVVDPRFAPGGKYYRSPIGTQESHDLGHVPKTFQFNFVDFRHVQGKSLAERGIKFDLCGVITSRFELVPENDSP